jgi:hypothetical protein
VLECLVVKLRLLNIRHKRLEGSEFHQSLNVLERLEPNKRLEITESEGNLGLVVGVCELVWLLFVELGGKVLVLRTLAHEEQTRQHTYRVQLQRQGLCY